MDTKETSSSGPGPVSASSSPSHEFSFTISLHSSSTTPVIDQKGNKAPPNSFAIDLSPADDIFFHGHLLPLHLLSHLPVSPRSSTNSLDSFTLPIHDRQQKLLHTNNNETTTTTTAATTKSTTTTTRRKVKSFSLFRRRKEREYQEEEDEDDNGKEKNKMKKLRFELSQVLKRYVRMVRPLMFFNRRKENLHHFSRYDHHQPYDSFSGNLSFRDTNDSRGINRRIRRGGGGGGGGELFSAPASIRTSPTNSGLLVATPTSSSTTSSDSTMEELQAAIQAAIAHCKNSISVQDKLKS